MSNYRGFPMKVIYNGCSDAKQSSLHALLALPVAFNPWRKKKESHPGRKTDLVPAEV
jgi:hypothetical protein